MSEENELEDEAAEEEEIEGSNDVFDREAFSAAAKSAAMSEMGIEE